MVIELNEENLNENIIKTDMPALVDFWAPWCGPCRMAAPVIDEIAAEYDGRLTVGKVNIDEHHALASQFGVMSIPTFILLKAGVVQETVVGLRSKKDLTDIIDRIL